MKTIFASLLTLVISAAAWAQTVDRSVTVENADTTGKISTAQLTDQANKQMAENLIVEYLGAEAFNRNKAALTARVINNSARFVPFQKAQEVERGPFGMRLTVEYKVSLSDFRKLLSESGVFSKTRLAQHVISFIAIEDESGNRLGVSWRPQNPREAQIWMKEWNDDFKKVFEKAGYTFNKNVNPAWLQTFGDNISAQDVLNKNNLGQSFILWGTGKVTVSPTTRERTLVVQTRFYSQDYKREVTDSVRRFSLRDDGHPKWEIWAQDLVAQLDEIDAKSLTQEALLKIVVKGAISLTEQDQFKQLITNSTPLIKSVSERRFEANQIVYEIQSDSNPQALAQKLATVEWKGKKLKASYTSSEVQLEIL